MSFYADLHVHSKYSRATSRHADLEHLAIWSRKKGLSLVATGDFTHPAWFEELTEKLVAAEPGLFRLHPEIEREVDRRLPPACRGPVRFMLEVEISTIYKKGDKTRKVHHLIYAANFETASRIRDRLGAIGNIASDGRPILGLDSRDLLEITIESGDDAYLIPAHIWTPWFAAMGSKSGFDSIEECYGDLAPHIFAVETGLSSDPPMNWRISGLDRFTLVSNSDAHSPPMLAREATRFETELDYFAIRRSLETGEGFGGTVEFFPEEGKYHLDGHRSCGVVLEPEQTRSVDGLCPTCGRALTVGVMHRVETLADREDGEGGTGRPPFRSLVPLPEVLSELCQVGPKSKTVGRRFEDLVARLGPELDVLDSIPLDALPRHDELLAEALGRLRRGQVRRQAGYDGEFGVIRLFEPGEIDRRRVVAPLFEFSPEPTSEAIEPPPTFPIRDASPPLERPPAPSPATESSESSEAAEGCSILARLDADQRQVASIVDGAILVIAGPGTGKTRTLTHRIAHRISQHGLEPGRCLAVTFTRKAAEELRGRLAELVPEAKGQVFVATFHGLALEILRRHGPRAYRTIELVDEEGRRSILTSLGASGADDAKKWAAAIRDQRRSWARGETAAGNSGPDSEKLELYEEALVKRGVLDFDGLLVHATKLLENSEEVLEKVRQRFQSISIDEYQDIDALQYRLVRLLAPAGSDLCAIGDPDQSIYRFRGAEVGFFLRFRDDYPGARVVSLTRNYRSAPTLVKAALSAVAPTSLVPERELHAVRPETDDRICLHAAPSARAEAEQIAHTIERLLGGISYFSVDSGRADASEGRDLSFSDIAVLYRTRAQAAPVAEALARAGMPYQERSHEPLIEHPGVATLASSLANGDCPEGRRLESWLAEQVERSEGREVAPQLAAAFELLAPFARRAGTDRERFLSEIRLSTGSDALDPRAQRISLLTLHAAKGLEFPVVFLAGCEDGLLPLRWPGGETDVEEERRLFFVGITRAESLLYLSWCERRAGIEESSERTISPFVRDIEAHRVTEAPVAPRRARSNQLSLF